MKWIRIVNRRLGPWQIPCRGNLPPDWAPIETKGDEPGKVNRAYWDPIVGDFLGIDGDPTHWRLVNPKLRRFQMEQILK